MRRFFFIISLVTIVLASAYGWQYLTTAISPCDQPLAYKLGQLDPRFNINANQARENITQAAAIWNKTASKILLQEDSQAKLSINFVYDERQALSTKIGSQEKGLNSNKKTLDNQISDFLKQRSDFEIKLASLNGEINDWNQKGGAPADVYKQIQDRSQNLKSEGEKLQTMAANLNQKTGNYNYEVKQLNNTVDDFNTTISQKPEEGLYEGATESIYIYLNSSQKILIHTLAHELGHALGLDHVKDPKSIMYTYTSENLALTGYDREELGRSCQAHRRLDILVSMIRERLKVLSTKNGF